MHAKLIRIIFSLFFMFVENKMIKKTPNKIVKIFLKMQFYIQNYVKFENKNKIKRNKNNKKKNKNEFC